MSVRPPSAVWSTVSRKRRVRGGAPGPGASKGCSCLCPDPQKAGSTTCIPSPRCPQPARSRAPLSAAGVSDMPRQLGCEGAPGRGHQADAVMPFANPHPRACQTQPQWPARPLLPTRVGLLRGRHPRTGSAESLDRAAVLNPEACVQLPSSGSGLQLPLSLPSSVTPKTKPRNPEAGRGPPLPPEGFEWEIQPNDSDLGCP